MPRSHPSAKAGPSQRMLRVGEVVRHALADLLSRGEVSDPVLAGHVITVPEVRMSADLKHATAYVMPLGGQDVQAVVKALEHNRKRLRMELARRIDMKFVPELRFRADERFAEAERIDRLLRSPEVARDLGKDDKQ
jgi:ribosome-binding factor A